MRNIWKIELSQIAERPTEKTGYACFCLCATHLLMWSFFRPSHKSPNVTFPKTIKLAKLLQRKLSEDAPVTLFGHYALKDVFLLHWKKTLSSRLQT